MKTLIQLVVVALVFGGLSAAATVFWKQRTATPVVAAESTGSEASSKEAGSASDPKDDKSADDKPAEDQSGHSDDHGSHSAGKHEPLPSPDTEKHAPPPGSPPESPAGPGHGDSHSIKDAHHGSAKPLTDSNSDEIPIAVRPPYVSEGDEAGALINLLRNRARTAAEKERKIAERQDAMKVIFDDLRADQAQTLKLRGQLLKELKQSRQAVESAMQGLDQQRDAMQKEQADIRKSTDDALKAANEEQEKLRKQLAKATSPAPTDSPASDSSQGAQDNANLKKMAAVFDSMPPEDVSKVVQQLVKNKRSEAVVWLMNAMKPQKAAKALSAIAESNPELAADLTDRLKRLKTAPISTEVPVPPAPE